MDKKFAIVGLIAGLSVISVLIYFGIFSTIHLPYLQPAAVDHTRCDINTLSDGSSYAQVNIYAGAACSDADSVTADASGQNGHNYISNGYLCTAKLQTGSTNQWASYWGGDFYSYRCMKGSGPDQIAFNIQTPDQSNNSTTSSSSSGSSGGSSSAPTSTPVYDAKGNLEPSPVGGTECDLNTLSDGSTYGQVAISDGATCTEAESVITDSSGKNGANYTSNGYSCTATKQGSNTQWSSYWNNDFYSYTCSNSAKHQVAFNWQTTTQAATITN